MNNFTVERHNMVESQIRTCGVTSPRLLAALREIPREAFAPPSQRSLAYMDGPLQVEPARAGHAARYLLAPMVFARLAQLAEITGGDKVLDVGAATGYSSAVLARLAASVVAVECDAGLAAVAKDTLASHGVDNVEIMEGPLDGGAADKGPYDVIFVNGRLAVRPDTLLAQLAPGGRLVAVMGGETASKARLFQKTSGAVREVAAFDAGCPALPGFEASHAFAF
jgi:protein-L-isoaspartate(D-aspartate) O-methyltransferase